MMERPCVVRLSTVPSFLWSFVDGQARFLRARGFDYHAVASPGPLLDRFAQREGVTVHAVEMVRRIAPLTDISGLARLTALFTHLQPHLVHGSTPKAGFLAMVAAQVAGVPVKLYHAPGLRWWTLRGLRRRLVMDSERLACGLAEAVLCAGPSVRAAMVDHGVCPADKAIVLAHGHTNGVDVDGRFNPQAMPEGTRTRVRATLGLPEDAPVAGFVGRLTADKGIEELAQAWPLVRERLPGARLLLVGAFEEFDPVSARARESLGADPTVVLSGWVEDAAPLYAAMDLCVIPTHREGFPTIALEAGAMGLPVVGTDAIGCVDAIVADETGVMVPVGDTAALAGAVRAYLIDADLRHRHGAAGRERVVRDFRREILWEAMLEQYRRLLARHGQPVPAE